MLILITLKTLEFASEKGPFFVIHFPVLALKLLIFWWKIVVFFIFSIKTIKMMMLVMNFLKSTRNLQKKVSQRSSFQNMLGKESNWPNFDVFEGFWGVPGDPPKSPKFVKFGKVGKFPSRFGKVRFWSLFFVSDFSYRIFEKIPIIAEKYIY